VTEQQSDRVTESPRCVITIQRETDEQCNVSRLNIISFFFFEWNPRRKTCRVVPYHVNPAQAAMI